jgi:hypothetical protein
MKKTIALAAILGLLVTSGVQAQGLDGSIAGDPYGDALAVQTVNTQFGDNLSELNAGYGFVRGGNLHLAFTGNLENNFNKLNIFIDSVAGGENVLTLPTSAGGNNPGNDGWANNYAGFTFDSGFEADYMFIARRGGDVFDLDFNAVGNDNVFFEADFGSGPSANIFGGTAEGANSNVAGSGIGAGFDNSNMAGVIGFNEMPVDTAAALAVQTGFELIVPLSALGNPAVGDEILISAHITSGGHDFLSNQFLGEGGGLPFDQGNLGFPGSIDLNQFAGNQFFRVTVVPEPSSFVVLGIAAMGLARRRRV